MNARFKLDSLLELRSDTQTLVYLRPRDCQTEYVDRVKLSLVPGSYPTRLKSRTSDPRAKNGTRRSHEKWRFRPTTEILKKTAASPFKIILRVEQILRSEMILSSLNSAECFRRLATLTFQLSHGCNTAAGTRHMEPNP